MRLAAAEGLEVIEIGSMLREGAPGEAGVSMSVHEGGGAREGDGAREEGRACETAGAGGGRITARRGQGSPPLPALSEAEARVARLYFCFAFRKTGSILGKRLPVSGHEPISGCGPISGYGPISGREPISGRPVSGGLVRGRDMAREGGWGGGGCGGQRYGREGGRERFGESGSERERYGGSGSERERYGGGMGGPQERLGWRGGGRARGRGGRWEERRQER